MMFVNLSPFNHEEYRNPSSALLLAEHRADCGHDQKDAHHEGEQLDPGRVGGALGEQVSRDHRGSAG